MSARESVDEQSRQIKLNVVFGKGFSDRFDCRYWEALHRSILKHRQLLRTKYRAKIRLPIVSLLRFGNLRCQIV